MVFKTMLNYRKKWNKSKIGRAVNTATGNRYGRGIKQIISKGVPQLTKDVMSLKKLLNVEKKRYDISVYNGKVGQINQNATAEYSADLTPYIPVGTGYNERNGASVKLTGFHMKMQFSHQGNTTQKIKLRCELVLIKGSPINYSFLSTAMYEVNPFVAANGGPSLIDYNSPRNPDTFGKYTILRKWYVTILPDQISGVNMITDRTLSHSFNKGKGHHIRFDKNSTTLTNGQLVLLITADCGNISSISSTSQNIPVIGPLTGALLSYTCKYYYVDN